MKKIVAVFDGLRFSESTLRYATMLASEQQAHLVGLFLDDFTYNSFSMYKLLKEGKQASAIRQYENDDKMKRKAAAGHFEDACREAHLNYSVHHDCNIAIQDLLHESIYADLIIIDGHETFVHDEAPLPTQFIRDLLTDVQCPVLVVPGVFRDIKRIMLLYDGEPSSVHAIRMFSYIFPELQKLETEVLSVNSPEGGLHLEDGRLMKEFIKRHFPHARYKVVEGQPEEEIIHYLLGQADGALVVLGAYRRGAVSRWFRPSMADVLTQAVSVPLFIAHNK
ncbi:MAG TPA: universal stress protein [Chitinophaga sp.]|uniref:universal stress protein n=1 Tax=Chitinophaga sp. TaxID=1869181 RepID=UPI002F941AFE